MTSISRSEPDPDTTRLSKKRQQETPKNYYDIPMLKPPVWKWEIATYFFSGGLSAGAYLIARTASRFGGRKYQDVTRAGTLVAAAAFAPCPFLLIRDLGDWKRFHYMLRVFKPQSPMSLGSWTLSGYGAAVALAALNELRKFKSDNRPDDREDETALGRGGAPDREDTFLTTSMKKPEIKKLGMHGVDQTIEAALDAGGTPLALLLAGYTGVLLSTTATPLWARKKWLGALFSVSAISTGASAIELALQAGCSNPDAKPSHAPLKRIETVAKAAEAIALLGYLAEAGELAAPITKGNYAMHLWGGAVGVGLIGSALLGAVPVKNKTTRRGLRIAGAAAGIAGGLALRWAITMGGHSSGKDPHAARAGSRPGVER